MHTPTTPSRDRRGFTLVELLVVIAIIAVLAAMGIGAAMSTMKKARMLADKRAAVGLAGAIDAYYADYNILPEIGAGGGGADTTTESDAGLMNILMAFGPAGAAKNPKGIRYYTGKMATASSSASAYDGLFYSGKVSVELFDVWKKRGSVKRHYQVVMDTDYDGEIADPIENGQTLYNIRALVWSTGADGKEARGNPRDPKNRDNVYTWRN